MPLLRKKSTPDERRAPVVSSPGPLSSSSIYAQRASASSSRVNVSSSNVSGPTVLQRKSNRDVRASMPAPPPQSSQSDTGHGYGNGRPSVLSQGPPGAAPGFGQMSQASRPRQSVDSAMTGGGGYSYGQGYQQRQQQQQAQPAVRNRPSPDAYPGQARMGHGRQPDMLDDAPPTSALSRSPPNGYSGQPHVSRSRTQSHAPHANANPPPLSQSLSHPRPEYAPRPFPAGPSSPIGPVPGPALNFRNVQPGQLVSGAPLANSLQRQFASSPPPPMPAFAGPTSPPKSPPADTGPGSSAHQQPQRSLRRTSTSKRASRPPAPGVQTSFPDGLATSTPSGLTSPVRDGPYPPHPNQHNRRSIDAIDPYSPREPHPPPMQAQRTGPTSPGQTVPPPKGNAFALPPGAQAPIVNPPRQDHRTSMRAPPQSHPDPPPQSAPVPGVGPGPGPGPVRGKPRIFMSDEDADGIDEITPVAMNAPYSYPPNAQSGGEYFPQNGYPQDGRRMSASRDRGPYPPHRFSNEYVYQQQQQRASMQPPHGRHPQPPERPPYPPPHPQQQHQHLHPPRQRAGVDEFSDASSEAGSSGSVYTAPDTTPPRVQPAHGQGEHGQPAPGPGPNFGPGTGMQERAMPGAKRYQLTDDGPIRSGQQAPNSHPSSSTASPFPMSPPELNPEQRGSTQLNIPGLNLPLRPTSAGEFLASFNEAKGDGEGIPPLGPMTVAPPRDGFNQSSGAPGGVGGLVRRLTRRGSERAKELKDEEATDGAGTGTDGSDREGTGAAEPKKEGRPGVLRALSLTRRGSKSSRPSSPSLASTPNTSTGTDGSKPGLMRRFSRGKKDKSEPTAPVAAPGPQRQSAVEMQHARAVALIADMRADTTAEEEARGRDGHLRPGEVPARPSRSRLRKSHAEASPAGSTRPLSHAPSPSPIRSGPYPLLSHLLQPALFAGLLLYLSYADWAALMGVCHQVGTAVRQSRPLSEVLLNKFLATVGYKTWPVQARVREPLVLTLDDLTHYLRGVSVPLHVFAATAHAYLSAPREHENMFAAGMNRAAARAYTRVVLRLRAQCEVEADMPLPPSDGTLQPGPGGRPAVVTHRPSFKSPLYRARRAPLLRVFVPSPEGDWLSDDGVIECEDELKRAGVKSLLRVGDVIWDCAIGDENNLGRLVWDGNFLIDLDYTYSAVGDVPVYIHALAFPPSYFHRVIRTVTLPGGKEGDPAAHADFSPWGAQIIQSVQLLQDRVKSEGHTLVKWVHRARFTIRPRAAAGRIPIVGGGSVDEGWYGTVVLETEGTNEGLDELLERVGINAANGHPIIGWRPPEIGDRRRMYRILRDRSRPGEIWLRTVHEKERVE